MIPGTAARPVDWYFDFVSPYSYFGLIRLRALPESVAVRCRPVLFAGLLEHWGHKGPAEISTKRSWTYRACVWYAQRNAIAFRLPAAHPFNSLPYLRLAIAAGSTLAAATRIFEELWTTGVDASDWGVVESLARDLDVDPARLADPDVKNTLRRETDQAVARGVFGVPTLVIGDQLFWGADSADFAEAFLADPGVVESPEMRRASALPVGASRKGV